MGKLIELPSWDRAMTALEELYYFMPDCAETKRCLKRIERIIERHMPTAAHGKVDKKNAK